MPLMAKKKPTPSGEPKRPNRVGVSLHVYIDPAIEERLQAYLNSARIQPSKTALVEALLKAFLREEGLWPPPAAPEQGKP